MIPNMTGLLSPQTSRLYVHRSCASTNTHCLVSGLLLLIGEYVVVNLLAVLLSGPVVPLLAFRSGYRGHCHLLAYQKLFFLLL